MIVEILTFKGKPASRCVTTVSGRLWADDAYYRQYVKDGPLEIEVPDEDGERLIEANLCREVRKPSAYTPKPRRKTTAVPTVVDAQTPPVPQDPMD